MTRTRWRESINMNKKLLIPIAVVLTLPGLYLGGIVPMSVNTEAWSPVYNTEELAKYSDLIIHGTFTDSYSYVEWHISGNVAVPSVYTVWTIKHSETFKGGTGDKTEFVVNGGTYNNIVQKVMHETELNKGDDVIVFLTKEPDSIYKNHYYMVGIESGIYKISGDKATNNYVKSSHDADSLKKMLKTLN